MEPRNLPKPNRAWNLGTFQTCTWNPCICGPPGSFTCNLEPRNFTWNPYWKPSKLLGPLFGILTWSLGTFRNFTWEPLLGASTVTWNLPEPILLLGWNLYMLYLEPRNLPEPLLGTLARNLGTFWNPLWLEPLLGTSEPAGTFTWNPDTWNLGTAGTLLGTTEPAGTFPWNPYTWNLGTFGTLLGTLAWNLGTCRNLYLEPLLGTSEPRNLYLEPLLGTSEPAGTFTRNPYLEPRNLPEPLLGTLTWNLGTCRNLYLEPLLGTSEPARTWRDDCPRVPQGLVWLGPQSFQLLGKNRPMSGSGIDVVFFNLLGFLDFLMFLMFLFFLFFLVWDKG